MKASMSFEQQVTHDEVARTLSARRQRDGGAGEEGPCGWCSAFSEHVKRARSG
jgi:hypothetical protein